MKPPVITSIGSTGATRRHVASDLLSNDARDLVKVEANRWIKRLRHVDYDGRTMRQRFQYRGDSLWWFTEIYLHKTRAFERAIETIFALEAAAADAPARLAVESTDAFVRDAAAAFSRARGVTVEVSGHTSRGQADRFRGFAVGPSAWLSRLRSARVRHHERPRVAAFVHTAFWHDEANTASGGRESYVGPVLDEIARLTGPSALATVGLGPRRNFRSRRWWDPVVGGSRGRRIIAIEDLAPTRELGDALALWRNRPALSDAIVSGPAVRDAAVWRGYDLWPMLSAVLRRAADAQWPWSARSMDEAAAALRRLQPSVVVTYAEAGGWGRALILEARRLGIPSVGLQHGFIYRHWLNYQHDADEMADESGDGGFPRPDRTMLFDGFAADTLLTAGHFPEESVTVTGSPRLDELAARVAAIGAGRGDLRQSLGVPLDGHLIVIAAKFSEIAEDLPAVVGALDQLPDVRAVIKPHPAEPREVYQSVLRDSTHACLAPAGMDLGSLIGAADAVLTKNSTAAIDAMTLGIPAFVVGLPNNLSPFVDASAMEGVPREAVRQAIGAVLYDRAVRQTLVARGRAFAERYRMTATGRSAAKTAEAVLDLARRTGESRAKRENPT